MAKRYGRRQKQAHIAKIKSLENCLDYFEEELRKEKFFDRSVSFFYERMRDLLGPDSAYLPEDERPRCPSQWSKSIPKMISVLGYRPVEARLEDLHVVRTALEKLDLDVMTAELKALRREVLVEMRLGEDKRSAIAISRDAVANMSAEQFANQTLTALAGQIKRQVTEEMGQ